MASPEELSEWLQSEEKREARPTPPTSPGGAAGGVGSSGEAGADLEAQLRAFTTQTSRTERRMGALEQMMQVMHEGRMFVLSRALVVSVSRVPEEAEVRRVLKELIRWNPALRTSVCKGESGEWDLVGEKGDVEPRLVCESKPASWREVAEQQMCHPIADNSAPQFRCHYLSRVVGADGAARPGEVAFVFILNHALIDGMSCVAILRKFVTLLNAVLRAQPYVIVPWTRMFPPVDEYCQKALDELKASEAWPEWEARMSAVPDLDIHGYFSMYNLYTAQCGTEAEAKPGTRLEPTTCLVTREMEPKQVDQLRLSCRRRGVTIQGAAQTAGVMALAALLPSDAKTGTSEAKTDNDDKQQETEAKPAAETELSVNLAVNLRNHVASDVPADYAGYYVALIMTSQCVRRDADDQTAEFWRLAKEANASIRGQIRNKDYLYFWNMMGGYAEKLKTLDLDSLRVEKESRTEMLFATTYGPWDFNAQPDDVIKTRGVYSASSVHRAGPVVQLQLLTVDGKLFITIAYSNRVLSRQKMEQFANKLTEILNQAADQ